jgi:predicted AlkP superfamily pyrophosphatase or phosphodiesterase
MIPVLQLIKRFLLAALIAGPLISAAQTDSLQRVNPVSRNSPEQQKKPYVILISADGFRYDYAEKYQATHLLALSSNGAQAKSMIPSFPSLTFPNHYTLVTGLYPAHHGLVNNSFYDEKRGDKYTLSAKSKVTDGSWYGGTPLWVLAEQQQMIAASLFWVI